MYFTVFENVICLFVSQYLSPAVTYNSFVLNV